jgi:hypothetical protein
VATPSKGKFVSHTARGTSFLLVLPFTIVCNDIGLSHIYIYIPRRTLLLLLPSAHSLTLYEPNATNCVANDGLRRGGGAWPGRLVSLFRDSTFIPGWAVDGIF